MTRPDSGEPILILGGTAEARALAEVLVDRGRAVITALAGRVRDPRLPAGDVRIGGFGTVHVGGVAGLVAYLRDHHIAALVDATHPFAATISDHAATAAQQTGTDLFRLERPGWADHPDAGSWTWVAGMAAAVAAGSVSTRPFLSTGRQSLPAFRPWADKQVTARVVDPPDIALPPHWRVILSRGPYAYEGERALLMEVAADLLVTKDSGGTHTAAKLDAARDLGVPVVVIARPPRPAGPPAYATVEDLVPVLP